MFHDVDMIVHGSEVESVLLLIGERVCFNTWMLAQELEGVELAEVGSVVEGVPLFGLTSTVEFCCQIFH